MKRHKLGNSKRWVIKIGSSLLTDEGRGLDNLAISTWVEQIARLRDHGKEIILVSSGAVAEGMARLGWKQRPHAINELQAAAAIGQMGLIQAYEYCFKQHKLHTAQVLLTHDDLANRERYLNARSTLRTLLKLGAVPIINENDTVATDEIRFGDNDTLGALVANLVEADLLVILTDQDGLFTADPRSNPNAELVYEGMASNPDFLKMAGGSGSHLGRGGMSTKITAARRAARSGAATLITSGRAERVLLRVARGEELGTLLLPDNTPIAARKQWLASHLKVAGCLTLDEGAVTVLKNSGKSLLAVGVTSVTGDFVRGEMVSCLAPDGTEIARGLVNYDAVESAKIRGRPTTEMESLLGYIDEPELIHRDNLILL